LIQNGIEEENIFVEIGSGANEIKNRSVFQKLINQKLKENDLLMVTKIARCSRNTLEFSKFQEILDPDPNPNKRLIFYHLTLKNLMIFYSLLIKPYWFFLK
jgi:hypothetical protein